MEERNNRKKIFILGICAIAIILASTLGTYAYFMTNLGREEKHELTITTGTLSLVFEDNSYGINATLSLGESVTKEFKIRNTGTQDVTTNMLFSEMVNTYMEESLSYSLEYKTTVDGDWESVVTTKTNVPQSRKSAEKNLATDLTIPAGATYYYKLTITFNDLNINQNDDIDAIFASKFKIGDAISPSKETLDYLEVVANKTTPNFAEPATTDEGVFAMVDDYGTSYYYRGAVTNNYVKFGDFYWRIIRINGDGSLRIIYDGVQGYENGVSNENRVAYTEKAFNLQYNDAKYVGWMFGGSQGETSTSKVQAQTNTTNSDIKILVDSWYKENIVDKDLGEKIADVVFCNDRTTPGKTETGYASDTGLGYGSSYTGYGATARTNVWNTDPDKVQPKFTCLEKNDAFTVSDENKGNGDLTYPVGLITVDEAVVAGSGKYGTSNSSYYLFKGFWYWTISPCDFNEMHSYVFDVNGIGQLDNDNVSSARGSVAPVINLRPEYVQTMIGDGTINNPYRDTNDTL
ncbi:MAG: hypothetical protein HFG33_03115 [Bacilli bacterium]|nr:hypothetical protein [Bacilli bacterium]